MMINREIIVALSGGILTLITLALYKRITRWYRKYKILTRTGEDLYDSIVIQTPDTTFNDVYKLMHQRAREVIDGMSNSELLAFLDGLGKDINTIVELHQDLTGYQFVSKLAIQIEKNILGNDN